MSSVCNIVHIYVIENVSYFRNKDSVGGRPTNTCSMKPLNLSYIELGMSIMNENAPLF